MFKILDGRSEFYQWDLDRQLIIEDATVNEVHFCNRTDDCSLVCEVYELDGLRVVNVPNVLLQDNWRINVYAYDINYTKICEQFDVVKRSKPADYVYTETEIKNYDDLAERVAQIEENGISDEAVKNAITEYLEENPIDVDLTGYATETYVDEAIAAIPAVDLSNYATKDEIPSIAGLATESYVDNKFNSIEIPEVDLTGYATEEFVTEKIQEAQISGGDVDLSNYYTKTETDAAIKSAVDAIEVPETDLSNYYTKSEVDAKIPDLTNYALKTDIPDVSEYQTAEQVQAAITTALGDIANAEEGAY